MSDETESARVWREAVSDPKTLTPARLGDPSDPVEANWQQAALRVGEDLAADGPNGYYAMTPVEWRTWARIAVQDMKQHIDALTAEVAAANEMARFWQTAAAESQVTIDALKTELADLVGIPDSDEEDR